MFQIPFLLAFAFAPGAQGSVQDLGEVPGPQPVLDGEVQARRVVVQTQRWGEGDLGPMPPQTPLTPTEIQRIAALKARNKLNRAPGVALPTDPTVPAASIVPNEPPTDPSHAASSALAGVDSDFVFFEQSQGPVSISAGWPVEPSVGTNGRVVAYCGNTYGLISTDSGNTFTQLNPNTLFGGNICCDQVMYYDRRHELLLWLMQGARNTTNGENVYTIAFSVGMQNIANQNFSWFTIDPQANGGQAAGVWWDFPEMTTSNDHMWFTTNNQGGSGSVMFRIELADIADGGTVGLDLFDLADRQVRLVQGATTVMYAAAHVDNSTQAVWRATATGTTANRVTRVIDTWQNGNSNAPGPDGQNWFSAVENNDHKIRGATVTATEVLFFWTASEGGGYPYPYWSVSRFSRNNSRTYLESNEIWSNNAAWAYASGHSNDRNDIAGTATYGGGTFYPSSVAWIRDSYSNTGTGFGMESKFITLGASGPPSSRWGDYLTARRHSPYGNTWVGTGFTLQGAGGTLDTPDYVWFGRRLDEPPATRTVVVGSTVTSAWQEGNSSHPYDSVRKGHFATEAGDIVSIGAGTYNETGLFARETTLTATGGSVVIQ